MSAPAEVLLDHIRRLASPPATPAETDATLLHRFVVTRDEAAFTALVRRHGALVYGVCRRVLRDAHGAEDAYQAVWVVLARKAASVWPAEGLAGWLHGVARQVALNALRGEARRRQHEVRGARQVGTSSQSDPLDELTAREMLQVLDEEVQRLPPAYRLPVLYCCVEGLSQEEAARRLGWTGGSLRGRLERGRRRLHERLARRGLTLAAALSAIAVSRAGAGEALTSARAAATARATLAGTGGISAWAAPLGQAGKATAALVFSLALLAIAGVGLLRGPAQDAPGKPASATRKEAGNTPRSQPRLRPEKSEAQEALAAGLRWLADRQAANGHWTMRGNFPTDTAATALALLPLLRAGEGPPAAALLGPHAGNVERGLAYLVRTQQPDGGFGDTMYAQALATLAFCVGYAHTADPVLHQPAQRALDFIARAQHPAGGWRYLPGQAGDTSVTCWQIEALDAGRAAGLRVDPQVLARAGSFLDSVATDGGSAYGYILPGKGTPTMTAAALWCRLLLGWGPNHAGVRHGVTWLRRLAPADGSDLYFLHFATRLLHAVGGADWKVWEPAMRRWLLRRQYRVTENPDDRGSWAPGQEGITSAGGQLLMTSLALLTLMDCSPPVPRRGAPAHAPAPEQVPRLRDDLGAEEFTTARSAMRALAGDPGRSVPLLAELLRPPPAATRERIAGLLADLGSAEFRTRDRADRELRKLGAVAEPAFRRALKAEAPLEFRRRVEGLLKRLEESRLSPGDLRSQRAIEVLACIATPEARRVLEEVAGGEPEARLTQRARAALRRLGGPTGAP
jgi:RNA polymerase sigma factor (sigma-70 family)